MKLTLSRVMQQMGIGILTYWHRMQQLREKKASRQHLRKHVLWTAKNWNRLLNYRKPTVAFMYTESLECVVVNWSKTRIFFMPRWRTTQRRRRSQGRQRTRTRTRLSLERWRSGCRGCAGVCTGRRPASGEPRRGHPCCCDGSAWRKTWQGGNRIEW